MRKAISRRNFIKLAGGGAAIAAGAGLLPRAMGKNVLQPIAVEAQGQFQLDGYDLFFGGTDGWIYLPPKPAIPPFHPDVLAPSPLTTYIFGFRNVTGLGDAQRANQKNKAQHNAPLFWINQNELFRVKLTNLGLALRPDLFDAHTLHWHGFRNVIPFFDGEPTGSVSVTPGNDFTYAYQAHDPGTYMYHCHVEDVEHVQMGMTGLVFIRPSQDGNTSLYPSGKYAYNDGDGSTGYDREYAMFLSEVWAEAHWADAHIQLPEWSDYRADFAMINGRVYPDTIAPNSPLQAPPYAATLRTIPFQTDPSTGDLLTNSGYEHLQYQPLSSLVKCNAGERVLLRFSNLGFKEAAMTLAGIRMRMIGKDATLLRGRDGTDISYETETLSFSAGESVDAIFTAPPYQGSPAGYDTYILYNRRYAGANNLAADWNNAPVGRFGGQATEIHVYPNGVPAQLLPNT
ncbi:MAG: multicopper oxidase domain-containing protein [Caldilineaceae bacterium]